MSKIWKQPEPRKLILKQTMLLVNTRGRVLETDAGRAKQLLAGGAFVEAPDGAKAGEYLVSFDQAVEQPEPKPAPVKSSKKKSSKKSTSKKS